MGYTVKVKQPEVIDVRDIYAAVQHLGFNHQDARTAVFLSSLKIGRRAFQFVANERGFDRLRVLCPTCGDRKQVLVVVEGEARCRACHCIAAPIRCRRQRNVLHARYFRPALLLSIYEERLRDVALSPRQRAIVTGKIRKLRRVMPQFILDHYDQGIVPIDRIAPPHLSALVKAL